MRQMRNRLKAGVMALALAFAQVVVPVAPVFASNNGTLKVHEKDTDSGTESNDPKVCVFNFEAFGLDANQTGAITITGQGSTPAGTYLTVNLVTNQNGDGATTPYINDAGSSLALADGHYKATLDNKFGTDNGNKAKSKVFKVKCTTSTVIPAAPTKSDVCATNDDSYVIPTTEGVDYLVGGVVMSAGAHSTGGALSVTITAQAQAHYVLSKATSWTLTFTDAACGITGEKATPPTPQVTDLCGPDNASWMLQTDTQEYTWSLTQAGHLVVTASPGYYFVFGNERVTSHDFGAAVDSNVNCPTVTPCKVVSDSIITAKSQFADTDESRSAGHYQITDNGLRIYTDDASSEAKVAWYKNVSFPLADAGVPAMDYTATAGTAAGMQMGVDFDDDGTADGILVGESIYGNDWWLSNGSAQFVKDNAPSHVGGFGSANHGTLDQWLTKFPDAKVMSIGFSLGSGVYADGLIKSLTFNCVKYEFKKAPITPCTVTDNLFDQSWMYDSEMFPAAGGDSTYNFEPSGLYLNTPVKDSYVYGLMDAGNTPIGDVDAMSYSVLRLPASAGYASTLPAYILLVDTNGSTVAGGEKYFFYEPYNTDSVRAAVEGTFQLWDAKDASAKWWMSGTNQKLQTWDYFVNQFPEAVVLAYGFNQGTSNAYTYTAVQDIAFDCAVTSFTNKNEGGNGGNGGDTPTVPTIPTTPSTPSTPATPAVGGKGALLPQELPMTGANGSVVGTWIALLAAILTYGAVYYLQPKKRFEQ